MSGLGSITQTSRALLAVAVAFAGTACREQAFVERFGPDEIAITDDLYAVTGVGDQNVWAVGYFGALYRSQDAGATWRKLDSGTEKSLYDISFADDKNGWAIGRNGYVIRTRDGGDTWVRQQTPRDPPRHLFALAAVDQDHAWIVGDWGSRFYTRDGGATWEDRSFLIHEAHPSFPYLDEGELAAFKRGEKVYDDVYLNDVFFVDSQHGWIAAETGTTYYTSDGGDSWQPGRIVGEVAFEPIPFEAGNESVSRDQWEQLGAMAATLNERAYLRVGLEGFLTAGELAQRENDPSFADERARSVQDFLEGEGVSQDRIKIYNQTPFDQESLDMAAFARTKIADAPRVTIQVIETPFLFDVKFENPQNGYMAGLGGVILLSDDGGQTWRYQPSSTHQGLFGIARGGKAMMAVGEKGVHRQSTDGGRHWAALEDGFQARYDFFGFLRDVMFATPERGWIVGQAGTVFRTGDGGLTWDKVDLQAKGGAEKGAAAGE